MKKLFTICLSLLILSSFGQAPPVLEATYLPVRNTTIRQVWDTTYNVMNVPMIGTNVTWDYTFANGQFLNIVDTFPVNTIDPANTPYGQYFPNATHAGFMRSPFQAFIADSNYMYWEINRNGMQNVGSFNTSYLIDSTLTYSNYEFYTPEYFNYLDVQPDTAYYVGYAKNMFGFKAKIKGRKIKTTTYVAYGTLKLPYATFSNVALVRETRSQIDSIFVDLFNTNNFSFFTTNTGSSKGYNFLRNNTFGTNFLMYLHVNPGNSIVEWGWYTLPTNVGSISGTAYTSTTEATPVTSGEAYLYREYSNYRRNDILARSPLDANGNFKFDSIPNGEYRIAIRPNETNYPNSLITYYGDTTNWIDATPIITTSSISPGHKIHVQFHAPPVGVNNIHGTILLDLGVAKGTGVHASNPIPGIGVVIKRNPGSSSARTILTDNNGEFDTGTLDDGSYTLFVDIPGLHMTGTYSFNVSGTSSVTGLDYTVGTDSIHPSNITGVREIKNSAGGFMSAYPNPYTSQATILLELPQSDNIKLEVYNILGEKIQVLDNGKKQNGTYTYTFSAKKLNYSAGVYFVKLSVGNRTDVIKLIEQ